MRSYAILFLCLFAIAPARATYVNSGKSDFATAASTACGPNGSGATVGNMEVMAIQANSATSVTISSLKVTTWTLDDSATSGGGGHIKIWHGAVTSSGVDTITVSFTSGTALIGSACAEYTSTAFDTHGSGSLQVSVTTNFATEDVVGFATSGCGISTGSPWTQRQGVISGVTTFAALADVHETSTGTYSTNFSACGANAGVVTTLYIPVTAKGFPMVAKTKEGLDGRSHRNGADGSGAARGRGAQFVHAHGALLELQLAAAFARSRLRRLS
jgi:hypothetical protein